MKIILIKKNRIIEHFCYQNDMLFHKICQNMPIARAQKELLFYKSLLSVVIII